MDVVRGWLAVPAEGRPRLRVAVSGVGDCAGGVSFGLVLSSLMICGSQALASPFAVYKYVYSKHLLQTHLLFVNFTAIAVGSPASRLCFSQCPART